MLANSRTSLETIPLKRSIQLGVRFLGKRISIPVETVFHPVFLHGYE